MLNFDPELISQAALRAGAILSNPRVQVTLLSFPVILALMVCFDAYRRGMNGLLWMLGILFTGGLLFPLYLLHAWSPEAQAQAQVEPPYRPLSRRAWRIRAKYHCPYCSRGVIEGSVFCTRCGGRVDGQLRKPYFRNAHPGATA